VPGRRKLRIARWNGQEQQQQCAIYGKKHGLVKSGAAVGANGAAPSSPPSAERGGNSFVQTDAAMPIVASGISGGPGWSAVVGQPPHDPLKIST
jgi:hypothetical protein